MVDLSISNMILAIAYYETPMLFVKANSRPFTVECVICGRSDPGRLGTAPMISEQITYQGHWQRGCLKPHIWECACGKFYPSSLALGSHVTACKRHKIKGHGRMDGVGYYGQARMDNA